MKTLMLMSLALILAMPTAGAEAPTQAVAVSRDDPALAWGPCPAFIPAGCQIAVVHGDPAAENADIFFKVPADFTIPHHWHTSAERMVLLSGELRVTYDGQDTQVLKPGMYAYGPAKLGHVAVCAAGEECVLFIAFEQPVDAMPVQ